MDGSHSALSGEHLAVSPVSPILAALDEAAGDGRQHDEVPGRTEGASDEDDYEPSLGPEPEEKGDFELDAQDELHEEYEEDGIRLGLQGLR